jgi:hypothetical protein
LTAWPSSEPLRSSVASTTAAFRYPLAGTAGKLALIARLRSVLALLLILLSLFTTPLASAAGVRAIATGVRASDLVVSAGMVIQRTRVDDGGRIVAEFNEAGTMTARFVYGTRPQVPDYMIEVVSGQVYRLLTDHLGSVRLLVRLSDGGIVQQLAAPLTRPARHLRRRGSVHARYLQAGPERRPHPVFVDRRGCHDHDR